MLSMVFATCDGLRDALLLDHLDAGHLLDRGGALGVRLVVAEIVARPDIDEADHRRTGGAGAAERQGSRRRRRPPNPASTVRRGTMV